MSEINMTPITVEDDTVQNKIFITIEGEEVQLDQETVGISFDDSEEEIMDKVAPIVEESHNIDISDLYKVRKMTNSENIFIIPNSTAGIK